MSSASQPLHNRRRFNVRDLNLRPSPRRARSFLYQMDPTETFITRPRQPRARVHLLRSVMRENQNQNQPLLPSPKTWDSVEEEIFNSSKSGDEEEAVTGESKECSICLQSYKEGDELVRLPCGHRFHVACLDSWIRIRSNCPYCRRVLHVRMADWVCVGIFL